MEPPFLISSTLVVKNGGSITSKKYCKHKLTADVIWQTNEAKDQNVIINFSVEENDSLNSDYPATKQLL